MGASDTGRRDMHHPRPPGRLRAVFALPSRLYQRDLGWLLTRRMLAFTYRGRRSGRTLMTVVEVIHYDRTTRESVVLSGYGANAGWYLSIKASPALRIQSGRLDYVPIQRFLSPREARSVAEEFARAHRLETRLVRPILVRIGAIEAGRQESAVELLASLPMVAFRPSEDAPSAPEPPDRGHMSDPRV